MMAAPDSTIEAASTATQPTSPRPMVRAAAVDAVRRGFRSAFWRASLAEMPRTQNMRGRGRRCTDAIGPGDQRA